MEKVQKLVETVKMTEAERIVDKYSDKISSAVKSIAEGLKQPAEHVYDILVKQELVRSITELVVLTVLLSVIIIGIKFIGKICKVCKEEEDYEVPEFIIPLVATIVLSIIFIVTFILNIGTIVQGILNPEYSAIITILEFIK